MWILIVHCLLLALCRGDIEDYRVISAVYITGVEPTSSHTTNTFRQCALQYCDLQPACRAFVYQDSTQTCALYSQRFGFGGVQLRVFFFFLFIFFFLCVKKSTYTQKNKKTTNKRQVIHNHTMKKN